MTDHIVRMKYSNSWGTSTTNARQIIIEEAIIGTKHSNVPCVIAQKAQKSAAGAGGNVPPE